MRQRLDYVSKCNRADTVFTEAWLPTVDSLVNYFDNHGNGNEKMMAHYLKGRVHHDMGEAPIALECYQQAVEMADTTSIDCDLRTLAAIYGQMADLFHLQYLPNDEMAATMASEQIAWRNKDTLNALISFSLRTKPYYLMNDTDSVLSIAKQSCLLFAKHGYAKNGKTFDVLNGNHDTLCFFCHFGIECVLLSYLINVSPMILWHGFVASTSSVTIVNTEERQKGIASFRISHFGDTSHLDASGLEPSFSARFCECYSDDTRH